MSLPSLSLQRPQRRRPSRRRSRSGWELEEHSLVTCPGTPTALAPSGSPPCKTCKGLSSHCDARRDRRLRRIDNSELVSRPTARPNAGSSLTSDQDRPLEEAPRVVVLILFAELHLAHQLALSAPQAAYGRQEVVTAAAANPFL
jgi:hypothetical protein